MVLSLSYFRSKSSKLAFAFDLIDEEKKGDISRRDMWRFFRSFMTAIVLLGSPLLNDTSTPSDYDHLCAILDESAMFLVDSIQNKERRRITFDELADWYSGEGCKISSWFELIDRSKWLVLAS